MSRSKIIGIIGVAWTLILTILLFLPNIIRFRTSFYCYILTIVAYFLLTEILFRAAYRISAKKNYQMIPKLPYERIYAEPHPYLPYTYKAKFTMQAPRPANYPLGKDKGYWLGQFTTNNYGFINGETGDRDIIVPKPDNLIRINCLGSSTTLNYLIYRGQAHSYPLELERELRSVLPNVNLEVNNCAMGAWTSAEIMINFLLSVIDTAPDIIIIYHGCNDLIPSLTPGFRSDYSHSKRNLGETIIYYKILSKVPYIPLAFINYSINRIFSGGQNIRHSLIRSIEKRPYDPESDFQGFSTYKRNFEHILSICKANNIEVVLSTFCFFEYESNNPSFKKLHEGVIQENNVIRELANKFNVHLVDNYSLIPKDEQYFVDHIHFSTEGMMLIASNFLPAIVDIITKKRAGSGKAEQDNK